MSRITLLAVLAASFIASPAFAQKKKPDNRRKAFLNAKEAGPDFKLQGEYVGTVKTADGDVKFGGQIIALGDGKFRAVGYPGGLPGAGWTGDEKKTAEGTRTGDSVTLKGKDATAVVKAGVITVTNNNGDEIGTLKKVTRKSPTLGARPPKGAVVLFGGKDSVKNWQNGRVTKDGLLMQGITSKQKFQSFKLHMEFMLSYMPYARGQGRSNSGVYMQGRYEVQILDSFGLEGKNNECGGIYEISDPSVNMCLPPLQWQTYDVEFTAAKYDSAGKKTADARMTVKHNGVLVQDDVKVPRRTRAAPVKEGPAPGPIYIQNHGNPLRFRNIWLVKR